MKHLSLLLTAALSLAAASAYAQTAKSSPATGASASPSTPPTIASAIDHEISIIEKEVVEAAEAMPEDKFDFSPEKLNLSRSDYKGVRTFSQQVKHIAASNYLIWSPITGEKPPDTVNDGKGPDNMTPPLGASRATQLIEQIMRNSVSRFPLPRMRDITSERFARVKMSAIIDL